MGRFDEIRGKTLKVVYDAFLNLEASYRSYEKALKVAEEIGLDIDVKTGKLKI